MTDYAQRYVDTLLREVAKETPFEASRILGEITATTARQPHIALFVDLGDGRCLGTTAGLSGRPMPLPIDEGFQYFELCATTHRDSPGILWMLSNIGNYMLSVLSPFFYGDPAEIARATAAGAAPEPKPFLPHQTLLFGGDGERMLFVPRWSFNVPMGPPVEVVEPLPITAEQWQDIGPMSLEERGDWVRALGARSADQWTPLLLG